MKIMKKRIKAVLSVMLAFTLVFGLMSFYSPNTGALGDIIGTKQFTISNPYETVNWDTWGAYKANLHTHSTVSDGNVDFRDMIEAYYSAGYDILAMTDHGTVNYGWDQKPDVDALIGAANVFKTKHALTTARKLEIYSGVGRSGRGMTEVPLGIELNGMSISKTHVNGFYADSGHHVRALDENDFEPCINAYQSAGGITHMNHIGEWADASGDPSVYDDPAQISYFKNIFNKYHSCVGFELVNTTDSRTKNDRKLWDKLLQEIIPTGRNIFGFANDDSHELTDIGKSWEVFMLPANNAANVRTAMQTGTFFAVSRYAKAELGDSFTGSGPAPGVTRITVNNDLGQIKLECENSTKVQWVANGAVIAEGNEIDLNSYESQVTCYVRAQISGPGGMCFVQPFPISSAPYRKAAVGFIKTPEDTGLSVKNNSGTVVEPNLSGNYELMRGDYTYTATAAGFISVVNEPFAIGTADIEAGTKMIPVNLERIPVLEPAAGSSTVLNKQSGYIYGLRQGITSLDGFLTINGSGSLEVTPTANGFGTGTVVKLVFEDQVYESFTVVIKGDADGDGWANGNDYTIASLIFAGMLEGDDITKFACDINGDGVVDRADCSGLELAGLFLFNINQAV